MSNGLRTINRQILLGETQRISQTNAQRAGALGGQASIGGLVGQATGEPLAGVAAMYAAGLLAKFARDLRAERVKEGETGGFLNGLLLLLSYLG